MRSYKEMNRLNHSYKTFEQMSAICERINKELIPDGTRFEEALDELLELDASNAAEELSTAYLHLLHVVDMEIEQIEQKTDIIPSCAKGCAHCCYFPIVLTPLEAKLILAYIDGLPEEDSNRIVRHLHTYLSSYQTTLEKLKQLTYETEEDKRIYKSFHLPCPLLDPESQSCLAYEARPIPCRTYLNYSHPDVCSIELLPKEPFSYAFLGEYYMQALHEYIQILLMDGEDEETLGVCYPDDAWSMAPLPFLLQELLEGR